MPQDVLFRSSLWVSSEKYGKKCGTVVAVALWVGRRRNLRLRYHPYTPYVPYLIWWTRTNSLRILLTLAKSRKADCTQSHTDVAFPSLTQPNLSSNEQRNVKHGNVVIQKSGRMLSGFQHVGKTCREGPAHPEGRRMEKAKQSIQHETEIRSVRVRNMNINPDDVNRLL